MSSGLFQKTWSLCFSSQSNNLRIHEWKRCLFSAFQFAKYFQRNSDFFFLTDSWSSEKRWGLLFFFLHKGTENLGNRDHFMKAVNRANLQQGRDPLITVVWASSLARWAPQKSQRLTPQSLHPVFQVAMATAFCFSNTEFSYMKPLLFKPQVWQCDREMKGVKSTGRPLLPPPESRPKFRTAGF